MPRRSRRKHSSALKAKGALARRQGLTHFDVYPIPIQDWNKLLIIKAVNVFGASLVDAGDHERVQQQIACQDWAVNDEAGFLATARGPAND